SRSMVARPVTRTRALVAGTARAGSVAGPRAVAGPVAGPRATRTRASVPGTAPVALARAGSAVVVDRTRTAVGIARRRRFGARAGRGMIARARAAVPTVAPRPDGRHRDVDV